MAHSMFAASDLSRKLSVQPLANAYDLAALHFGARGRMHTSSVLAADLHRLYNELACVF